MYINTQTTQYPMSERDIKALYPNTSFSEPFQAPEPFAWVFPAPQPTFSAVTHSTREAAPVLTNKGTWEQTWELVDLDEETVAVNQARELERVQTEVITNTQKRLDDFARTKNYDGILSAATYATDPDPKFAAEGQRAVELRSATWSALYAILAEVQAGTRPVPTGYADIEPDLPALSWTV
jgi:hypothetical protein